MAKLESTKIYKDMHTLTVRLLGQTKHVNRTDRYDLWSETKMIAVDSLDYLMMANRDKSARVSWLDQFLTQAGRLGIRLGLLTESRVIPAGFGSELMVALEEVVKQAGSWKSWALKNP